jgi:hypothetical protein
MMNSDPTGKRRWKTPSEHIESPLLMNQNMLTNFLVGILALAILATAAMALWQVRSVQKLNTLQFQTVQINRNRAAINGLATEAIEYSKRNPAMVPLLQSVGLKPKQATPAGSPPAKP